MNDYILNLLINTLLMAFGVLSVIDLIYTKDSSPKFLKRFRKGGLVLLSIAIASIVFNFIKDKNDFDSKQELGKQKKMTDSILHATQMELREIQLRSKETILLKVEETYLKSINATNDALAKYNLAISDSLDEVLVKAKLKELNPQLSIAPQVKNKKVATINDSTLNIHFRSHEATCYNILLKAYIIDNLSNVIILQMDNLTIGKSFLPQNIDRTFFMDLNEKVLKSPKIHPVFITGTFSKDNSGKDIIDFNHIFEFDFGKNQMGKNLDIDFKILIKTINEKNAL